MIRSLHRLGVSACVLLAVACTPTMHWEAKSASDFTPSGHTVSVLGVYKDGQMSAEAWDALRPRLEPLMGGRECEIAAGGRLANGPLFTAVDEYTRTNGPTEDLLAQLAPAAQGDLILVLVEAGSLPPPPAKVSVVNSPAPAGPSATGSTGAAGLNTFAQKKHSGNPADQNVLQLTASLFSVAQRRSVALIDLQYSGDSVAEAESEFTARFGRLLPATTCRGWDWHTNVDPEQIRKLAAE